MCLSALELTSFYIDNNIDVNQAKNLLTSLLLFKSEELCILLLNVRLFDY